MPRPPWYKDGLQFSCTCSGHCCSGAPGYVWVNSEEIAALAAELGMTPNAFGKKYLRSVNGRISLIEKPDYDCVFLEDKKCTVYNARPVQCRTYPFWPEIMESKQAWKRESAECPGINQGFKHTMEAIRGQLKATTDAEEAP